IQRHEYGARFEHSENPGDDPNRISTEECDHRSASDSAFEQKIRESIRIRFELAITHTPACAFDGRLRSQFAGHPAEHLLHALVTHLVNLSWIQSVPPRGSGWVKQSDPKSIEISHASQRPTRYRAVVLTSSKCEF